MGQLQKDISDLVAEIGKKEGYFLIISNIGVIYSQPAMDITNRLIQDLNAKSGKKGRSIAALQFGRRTAGAPQSVCAPKARQPRLTRRASMGDYRSTSWPSCGGCRTVTVSAWI